MTLTTHNLYRGACHFSFTPDNQGRVLVVHTTSGGVGMVSTDEARAKYASLLREDYTSTKPVVSKPSFDDEDPNDPNPGNDGICPE